MKQKNEPAPVEAPAMNLTFDSVAVFDEKTDPVKFAGRFIDERAHSRRRTVYAAACAGPNAWVTAHFSSDAEASASRTDGCLELRAKAPTESNIRKTPCIEVE